MKKFLLYLILTVVVLLPVIHTAMAQTAKGSITVVMNGFKNDKGNVRVALVNNKESFVSEDVKPFMGAITKINGNSATYKFKDVPLGEYAIKFFHDENSNGVLDLGAFGIPKEEYGFSNNAGSKNYDKAKFKFDGSDATFTIKAK